ncbi:MAG TPA: peptide deformylase [Candidatus Paceibacterota bacterium]|jgi:peptide deformylase|nr:peptide deformylase [Candidatus Paceibacterota bacterium]HRR45767.1 peptide deformylase [Candidatus Paceibacterota bacterium]
MVEILTGENNPLLRTKCQPVEKIDKNIRSIIEEMKETMERANGVGLAANQIGYSLRIITVQLEDKFYAFINPEIVKTFPATSVSQEGCLSLPLIVGEVERPEKIILKATDLSGKKIKKIKRKFFGLLARIIQHEVDHLDGILFIDKAKNITKLNQEINSL